MKINFVLPGASSTPSGGFRMVYEYSNWLVSRGHSVTIIHPAYLGEGDHESRVSYYRRACTRYFGRLFMRRWKPKWFSVRPEVELRWVPWLSKTTISDADIIIATYWRTAELVAPFSATKGRKFYFIQGLETWGGNESRVLATWQLPFTRIVIAQWLGKLLESYGASHHIIQNGINNNIFYRDNEFTPREQFLIGMMWHALPLKGSSDGLSILNKMHEKDEKIKAILFGTMPRPSIIPSWIEYVERPASAKLREIYNRCIVFLAPSHGEGWGLTASEAMMCGSAVLATSTQGHLEFIEDGKSGLMFRAQDVEDGVNRLSELLANRKRLDELANEGLKQIEKFSLKKKSIEFEAVLSMGESLAGTCPAN